MKRVPFRERSIDELLENTTHDKHGCMIWNGTKDGCGYAVFDVGGRWRRISRHILGITDKNIYACHKCDNPACIRPDHLFAGTQSDNLRDHWSKVKSGKTNRCGWLGGVLVK